MTVTVARAWTLLLLVCIPSAFANGSECDSTSSAKCTAPQSEAHSVVYADYGPEKTELVQEDVNDPDMIMHMQMRVAVDLPLDSEHSPKSRNHEEKAQQAQAQKPNKPSLTTVESKGVVSPLASMVVERSTAHAWKGHEALAVIQMWTGSLPLLQIATVLGIIGSMCVIIRKLMSAADRAVKSPLNKFSQLDPSARLHILLQALRFEPQIQSPLVPCEEEIQENSPVSEYDSGNNTEEEPEAEAAVESAVIAIAKRAKTAANQAKQPSEPKGKPEDKHNIIKPQQMSTVAAKAPQRLKAEKTEIGLKVQVLSC